MLDHQGHSCRNLKGRITSINRCTTLSASCDSLPIRALVDVFNDENNPVYVPRYLGTLELDLTGVINVEMATLPGIKKVIFNDPATIVLWADGTKTVVKVQKGDTYIEAFGLLMCIAKKAMGNKGNFNNAFHKAMLEAERNG